MALEHVLTDIDTVRNLAVRYGVSWEDIVEYNGLEYPYTLTTLEAYRRLYASGYLTVTRTLYTSEVTIYAGSTFMTETDAQGIQKVYEVVEDAVIPAGEPTGYLYARCTLFGSFGNTIQNTIILAGDVQSSLGQFLSQLTITNAQPFTNGMDALVRVTGQSILIPAPEDLSGDVQKQINVSNYLNQLGGEDLELLPDGDITDDSLGDLGSVIGVDNIAQAIRHRLMTPKGSLVRHPEYGSDLHSLIGRANLPYINSLIEVYIHDALSTDDRFTEIVVEGVSIAGTVINVQIRVSVVKSEESVTTPLEMDFSTT